VLDVLVLHAVIQDEEVGVELADGVPAGAGAVAIHEHQHIPERAREHERLVARPRGIEQEPAPVVDDARLEFSEPAAAQAPNERELFAFIPSAEDGHAAAAVLQLAGEPLDHRRLARAAYRQVAHAHDHDTELAGFAKARPVEPKARLHDPAKDPGEAVKKPPEQHGAFAEPALQDDVGGKLFEAIEAVAKSHEGGDSTFNIQRSTSNVQRWRGGLLPYSSRTEAPVLSAWVTTA
jgi:hypothetical protein